MTATYKVVAVNGSPHEGFGNTSQMLSMLREPLAAEGVDLEEIPLSRHRIEYCAGCATCLEKGECWIQDDHQGIVDRLLAADGVILASPVYFRHVTAQLKTFLDRSLRFGHRPRGTWKPGLAVCVSAGWGETEVARYLARILGAFGAFSVGELTAIAIYAGEFMGKDLVAARAVDLARDLARAIREKRAYPANDLHLDYWHFMRDLVHEHSMWKADNDHWQRLGFFESFEKYIGQTLSRPVLDPALRAAWLKEVARRQQERSKRAETAPAPRPSAESRQSPNLRQILEAMPQSLNREAARGLDAVVQFDVSGPEAFVAHIRIEDQRASFHEGPAARPSVTIKTPADVWLAVCRGTLDGAQAYMSGKYRVEGDLSLLMRLNELFPR
jgi:multimeric flavodoxin WrbA/putative sterol carrier protein